MEYLVAVSSRDGVMVHQHFGHTEAFQILKVTDNESYSVLEQRSVAATCNCGEHDENRLAAAIEKISDCRYVLSAKIGPGVQYALQQRGIIPLEITHYIDYAMKKVMLYDKRKHKNLEKE